MIGIGIFLVTLTVALVGDAYHPSDWWVALWTLGFVVAIFGAVMDA